MNSAASKEVASITSRLLAQLLATPPLSGSAADLRLAIGDLDAHSLSSMAAGTFGDDLLNCFEQALLAGANVNAFDRVRKAAQNEDPLSIQAVAVVAGFIQLSLAYQAKSLATITFKSRQAVETMLANMNAAFEPAEEYAADQPASDVYRALIGLHAAVTRDLITRSKPLPRIVNYSFGRSFPSLKIAQVLYGDASRAEEVYEENRVPHPLFMLGMGRALSA
jgi:hypothetical protein